MKWIFAGLLALSLIFGVVTGNMAEVTKGAINGPLDAAKMTLTLAGSICLWSGVMQIASEAGLTQNIARIFAPILSKLFRNMDKEDSALESISMNISANILGLGNAATPLGIEAMKKMQAKNRNKREASHNMILFVVINTSSLQLIPTTIATLRLAEGSSSPMEILPAMLMTSLCSLIAAVVFTKIFAKVCGD